MSGKNKEKSFSDFAKDLGNRISQVADSVGGKQSLARKIGTSVSNIYRYINGERAITAKNLVAIAKIGGVDLEWLGSGNETSSFQEPDSPGFPGKKCMTGFKSGFQGNKVSENDGVLYFSGAKVEFRQGNFELELSEAQRILGLKEPWEKARPKGTPEDLCLFQIRDESMDPTLKIGEIILVDRRETEGLIDGIYVFCLEKAFLIKRLQRFPEGLIQVISDNQAYKSFSLNLDRSKVRIVGRAIWAWGGRPL